MDQDLYELNQARLVDPGVARLASVELSLEELG